MRIIDQSYEIWGPPPVDRDDAILYLERGIRICYRSEDKIIEGSGEKIVTNCFERGHYSVLEMSNLVLRSKKKSKFPLHDAELDRASIANPFLKVTVKGDYVYIGGNWRAWIEEFGFSIKDMPYIQEFVLFDNFEIVRDQDDIPPELFRVGVCFITDRAVSHEMVRHRPCSFLQESQRYVRYMDDIAFIKPWWYNEERGAVLRYEFDKAVSQAEDLYKYMVRHLGAKAEEARIVLPNATATKILVMADIEEWKHIFKLRTSKAAYRQYRDIITMVEADFIDNGWI
jgi:thymidylate synthase (FAD)